MLPGNCANIYNPKIYIDLHIIQGKQTVSMVYKRLRLKQVGGRRWQHDRQPTTSQPTQQARETPRGPSRHACGAEAVCGGNQGTPTLPPPSLTLLTAAPQLCLFASFLSSTIQSIPLFFPTFYYLASFLVYSSVPFISSIFSSLSLLPVVYFFPKSINSFIVFFSKLLFHITLLV